MMSWNCDPGVAGSTMSLSERRLQAELQALIRHLRPASGGPSGVNVSGGASYHRQHCTGSQAEGSLPYEKDGFVVVRRLVGEDRLKVFGDRFREICSGDVQVKEGRAGIACAAK